MPPTPAGATRRFVVLAVVSVGFAAAGFAVLLFHVGHDPSLSKLAAGWLGAVIGFWLQ
jgi:VanZ family protein